MKRKFWYSVLVIFLFFGVAYTSSAQPNPQQERISGWSADIDTMLSLMKIQHYVYRSKPLPQQLLVDAKNLKENILHYSDERMLGELERLMFYMHDGHSYVLPLSEKVQAFWLPVVFYIFSDGVFIINADDVHKDLIGCKVLSIGGVDINRLINDMNSYVHQDNKFTVKWFAPSFLRFRGVYEYYGLKSGSADISLEYVTQNHKNNIEKIQFFAVKEFHGILKLFPSKLLPVASAPLYLSNVDGKYWYKKNSENDALYVQFNQVLHKQEETLFQFGDRLDSLLKADKPKLLIIDVRHNNGGSLQYLTNLVQAIKNFDQQQKSSKIVVITGRNTFSAAQVFISQINKETHALFAGEPSSSSPNFVGEENYFILPYSKATISISDKYHETIPGDTRKWIEPDYPVSLSSAAYFKNEDPVLKFILNKTRW